MKTSGIDQARQQYTFARGGDYIKKHKIIQETQINGFKVTSYVEDVPPEERSKKDNQSAKQAIKIMAEAKSKNKF